jgi:predicted acylesterase/phospholipase RssA
VEEIHDTRDSPESREPKWIGLALSGGGFRATLFHLGLIRLLRDCNLLDKVELISSASGGSILAAHLGLNWSRYTGDKASFEAAERELIEFTQLDIRDRIIRRWFCANAFIFPKLLGAISGKKSTVTSLLAAHFDDLYHGSTFAQLSHQLELHILTTSLTTGALCKFTNKTFEIVGGKASASIDSMKVSFGVSASAAFPPLFPAVPINNDILNCTKGEFDREYYLTDGGVVDNLGIQELIRQATARSKPGGLLIVSNASAILDWEVDNKYSTILSVSRNVRANDIMMSHLASVTLHDINVPGHQLCIVDIHGKPDSDDELCALTAKDRLVVRKIPTDINSFSEAEALALRRHGYAESRKALRAIQIPSLALRSAIEDLPLCPPIADLRLENRKGRKWNRLFAPGDVATWLAIVAIALWVIAPWAAMHAYDRYQARRQREADLAQLRQSAEQSRARWLADAFGATEDQGANRSKNMVCRITVKDGANGLPNLDVRIEIENPDHTVRQGTTSKNGQYLLFWNSADWFARAKLSIHDPTKLYGQYAQIIILGEQPEYVISLNKQR